MRVFSDAALDSNAAQTLALNFGVAFSDSLSDGTPVAIGALAVQGQIPTTVGIGGGQTTPGTTIPFSSYSGGDPNDCFGTITQNGDDAPIPLTDITWNGAIANYPRLAFIETPLVEQFNLWNSQGLPFTELGFFDVYAIVKTVAHTAQAGNLIVCVEYAE
ncbi:MAG: hypothetical protein WBG11_08845 [Methylocella sp.]